MMDKDDVRPVWVHLGVTGTQSQITSAQAKAAADVFRGLRAGGAEWMHNGDCVGADARAGAFWKTIGGKVHLHPPSNDAKRAYLFAHASSQPKPYLERNTDIVAASDALVALPKTQDEELRSGTWSTIRRARKKRIPIIFV